MDKTQKAKANMFIVMGLFFLKYATSLASFIQLVSEITGFTSAVNTLDADINKQGTNISGITVGKDELLDKAIKLLVKSSRKARVWAVKTGNSILAAKFDVRVSTYVNMSQTEVLNALTAVNEELNTHILSLLSYRVVAADITDITNAIAAAQLSIGTPKQAIINKQVITQQIVVDIEKCSDFLELIDDLLISEYEDSNAEMVTEYKLSRELQPIGVHHTGLLANCLDAITKKVLEGVLVTIVEIKKFKLSDIDGIAEIEKLKPGKYHVTFTLIGYEDYTVIIQFHLGKIQEVGALMLKKIV